MSDPSIVPFFEFTRIKMVSQTIHKENQSVLIQMEPDQRCHPLCHECGLPAQTVHSKGHRRFIRDLSIADTKVLLQVGYRKVWCEKCSGAKVEKLSFADATKRITHRLARSIYDLCKVMTVKDVADHFDLNPKTVKAVDKHFLERDHGQTDYTGLRILAMDEIAIRKGHNYMTVVLDYLTGRVVWMGEGRKKATLDIFFAGMTDEQKANIEAVAIDMWEPFINRIKHHCPDAKIVFDMFHVVQAFGKVIDKVRRDEFKNATAENQEIIKGSRYILLKNKKNLRENQRSKLAELLEANETLSKVYILKDQLKNIYHYKRGFDAKLAIDSWCEMAAEIDQPDMKRFIGRLRTFEEGILNHCKYPIGTSKLEGVNNKIKVIKRKAYGFHDNRYFALKVIQAFSD